MYEAYLTLRPPHSRICVYCVFYHDKFVNWLVHNKTRIRWVFTAHKPDEIPTYKLVIGVAHKIYILINFPLIIYCSMWNYIWLIFQHFFYQFAPMKVDVLISTWWALKSKEWTLEPNHSKQLKETIKVVGLDSQCVC